MQHYHLAIIGSGVSAVFALQKLVDLGYKQETIVFDIGRPPLKRRTQLHGWLGCLPNGDGKIYLDDNKELDDVIGGSYSDYMSEITKYLKSKITPTPVTNAKPNKNVLKNISKQGFEFRHHKYLQTVPKDSHTLSKIISKNIYDLPFINFKFDEEVMEITKQSDGKYFIVTQYKEYTADNILLSTGRAGWRWSFDFLNGLGVIKDNNVMKLGLRIECPIKALPEFNESCCSLLSEKLSIGPMLWGGTVIPEDHTDLTITSFRSNETRWQSDKVSFNLLSHITSDKATQELSRLAALTFIVSNDRVYKESLKTITAGKSKISIIQDYGFLNKGKQSWLVDDIMKLNDLIPGIINKAYSYVPTVTTTSYNVQLNNKMQTPVGGLYVVGEAAGFSGLMPAMVCGYVFAENFK